MYIQKQFISSSINAQNRCGFCKKKMGLLPFSCKCGGLYCVEHRSDISHKCTYDYTSENKRCLSTSMIKLEGKKIESI